MNHTQKQLSLFVGALLVRLPFLQAGYGVEEDSWGHVLHAALLHETGVYEVSRLPGHPLYEGLLFVLWNVHSPLLYNLLSAIAAAFAVVIFYRIARLHLVTYPLWWSIVFGFVPTLFISSTYTIDYCIALLFSLLSYESALKNKPEASGVWLAIAAGFRITALGMLLPLGYLILKDVVAHQSFALRVRSAFKVFIISTSLAFVFYLPPFFQYGIHFFDFHKPPYPIWPEIIYKMTIGVWGLLGTLSLAFTAVFLWLKRKTLKNDVLNGILILVVCTYGIAYFRMPEKAAFWIPVVPFIIIFIGRNLPKRLGIAVGSLLLISGWLFGINTTNALTGSAKSKWAKTMQIANEDIFIDPIYGAHLNDFSKRHIKAQACARIEKQLMNLNQPTLVIAGWWYAMLEVDKRDGLWANTNAELVYFASPKELMNWKAKGYNLRYLPEQAKINDIKYHTDYTVTNATLLPLP